MASVKSAARHKARTTNQTKKKPKQQRKRELNVLLAMTGTAFVLGIIALTLLVTKLREGDAAGDNAAALLHAYENTLTSSPVPAAATAGPVSSQSPEPSATPDETFEQTNEADDTQAAAGADEHRASGEDEAVDESGEYVQPDAPEEMSELAETIERIVSATDENGVIGILEIPELDEELAIIGKWSYKLLKISICRYKGPDPNQPGNLVLIGHNYKNGSHFGRLSQLSVGSELYLTDTATGARIRYEVYQIKSIAADAFSALKSYEGECGLTLMTCKDNGTNRRLLRCRQAAE